MPWKFDPQLGDLVFQIPGTDVADPANVDLGSEVNSDLSIDTGDRTNDGAVIDQGQRILEVF